MNKETHIAAVDHRLNLRRESPQHRLSSLSVLVMLAMVGCGKPVDPGAQAARPPAADVKIAQPLAQDVTEWDEYTGRIEAVSSVDIRARVSGYLEKVNFKAGAKVKKGDLLFLIDPKPFSAQLQYAEAELERAKAKRELAKNDLERAERLFGGKAISEEEHDARSKGSREAVAAVQSAEANVYTARLNMEFTKIRAPIDGRIGRELITEGNLVSGGGADATRLTFIVSIDPVYVYVDADERSALKYRRQSGQDGGNGTASGQTPVQLAVADETGFPHEGHLNYISPREDTTTGTVTLRGEFANPDGLLSPGFFARMRVRGSVPYPAILLPDKAIATDQAQRFVWVVKPDNQVEYRQVFPGAHIGQSRVITQGLKPDDWVVVDGLQKIRPGLKVNPERISLTEPQGGLRP